jgi:hypothetical protein
MANQHDGQKEGAMKVYTGKANSIDEAIKKAAQAAVADIKSHVSFSVAEVRGTHREIAENPEVEVELLVKGFLPIPNCQEAFAYQGYQCDSVVTVIAYGQHRSTGYQVALELGPEDCWPPQFVLIHNTPAGPVAQVITPFVVFASFRTNEIIKRVVVRDGQGEQIVGVKQVDSTQ